MTALPALQDWEPTRTALHRAALILSVLQVGTGLKMPFSMQYSLQVTQRGLATYDLPFGDLTLDLGWVPGLLHIDVKDVEDDISYALHGCSAQSLMARVLSTLQEHGFAPDYNAEHVDSEDAFAADTTLITEYGHALNTIYTAFSRARAKMMGYMSPLVLWPHHFDLGFMWFNDPAQHDEHTDAHLNFGFSPGDEKIARPYFYVYGWEEARGYLTDVAPAPEHWTWEAEAFTGLRLDYDTLRAQKSPATLLEQALLAIYQLLPPHFS